jgi:hypothetical protein
MSDNQENSHPGLVAGISTALPMGVVLEWFVFENLLIGLAAALVIGVVAGLLAEWRLGAR